MDRRANTLQGRAYKLGHSAFGQEFADGLKGHIVMVVVSERETGSVGAVEQRLGHSAPALIVFSHLRWSGVYQRPQHLLSRFAQDIPVMVVEEPMFLVEEGAEAYLQVAEDGAVTVLTPMLPISPGLGMGFSEDSIGEITRLITPSLVAFASDTANRSGDLEQGPIVWYYTPMALGILPETIKPSLVVFDAMDDLASFRNAPQALRDKEAAMFRQADLVFAGGPSLYEARRDRHPSVHCFPSGVEAAHFARATDGLAPPDGLSALLYPVLGFYGVLDERLDFDLIAAVADARPEWSLALIGPLAKIDQGELPRRRNISYFGQQRYADLPAFLAGFDVAILPFAINEATRSISPTKTLEYLAAEKPVVSTPIADVASLYGDVVRIVKDAPAFVAAVDAALGELAADRRMRLAAGRAHLLTHDWDTIAEGMATLMVETLTARSGT